MAILRPFQAIRPQASLAGRVAALPYDVMNSQEAREAVKGNPYSFLHVDKAEIFHRWQKRGYACRRKPLVFIFINRRWMGALKMGL